MTTTTEGIIRPNPLQVVTYGWFIFCSAFFGLNYVISPDSLLRVHNFTDEIISETALVWARFLIRGWGCQQLTVALFTYILGPKEIRLYLATAVSALLNMYVHVSVMGLLDTTVFSKDFMTIQCLLSFVQIALGLCAFIYFPAPIDMATAERIFEATLKRKAAEKKQKKSKRM